jgi:hypothetical protein
MFPQMNCFSSLDLWKSSREEGGYWDAFFVQLIVTFPIKLPKEEKKRSNKSLKK